MIEATAARYAPCASIGTLRIAPEVAWSDPPNGMRHRWSRDAGPKPLDKLETCAEPKGIGREPVERVAHSSAAGDCIRELRDIRGEGLVFELLILQILSSCRSDCVHRRSYCGGETLAEISG
jgi:hypothetical protein